MSLRRRISRRGTAREAVPLHGAEPPRAIRNLRAFCAFGILRTCRGRQLSRLTVHRWSPLRPDQFSRTDQASGNGTGSRADTWKGAASRHPKSACVLRLRNSPNLPGPTVQQVNRAPHSDRKGWFPSLRAPSRPSWSTKRILHHEGPEVHEDKDKRQIPIPPVLASVISVSSVVNIAHLHHSRLRDHRDFKQARVDRRGAR